MESQDEILKAFGQALRAVRMKQGLSQLHIANVSDIDRAYVSELERGLKNPSLVVLFRLAEALEASPIELIKETVKHLR